MLDRPTVSCIGWPFAGRGGISGPKCIRNVSSITLKSCATDSWGSSSHNDSCDPAALGAVGLAAAWSAFSRQSKSTWQAEHYLCGVSIEKEANTELHFSCTGFYCNILKKIEQTDWRNTKKNVDKIFVADRRQLVTSSWGILCTSLIINRRLSNEYVAVRRLFYIYINTKIIYSYILDFVYDFGLKSINIKTWESLYTETRVDKYNDECFKIVDE